MTEFTSPAVQAMNLIRYIGDHISESGEPIDQLSEVGESIGAPSEELANDLVEELCELGLIRMGETARTFDGTTFINVNLSLEGWERYEAEKRGEFDGNYGFIAMEFDDPAFESFVKDVVKPAVKDATGCDLVDMRDRLPAGVIDHIMRVRIRDAKFVIADLTHDNHGAYWEGGYAEGLGKPVIYICEKEKFDEDGTHFDTNHCTTVLWSRDNDEGFRQELTATIRRSLDESA